MFNNIRVGLVALSADRLLKDRCELGSYAEAEVVSSKCQKVKNIAVDAAHSSDSTVKLKDGQVCSHTSISLQRIAGVIGKQEPGVFPFCLPLF